MLGAGADNGSGSKSASATRSGRTASTALTAATVMIASPIPISECTPSIAGSEVPRGIVSEIASSTEVAAAPAITASQETTPTIPRNTVFVCGRTFSAATTR